MKNSGPCRFDYAPGRMTRAALACTVHRACPMRVTLWRDTLLCELASKGLLVGQARRDAEGRV